MLELAVTALVIAAVAGLLGFTGLARGLARFALIIFGVFLVLAIVLFVVVLIAL